MVRYMNTKTIRTKNLRKAEEHQRKGNRVNFFGPPSDRTYIIHILRGY